MEPPIKIIFCIIKKSQTKEASKILNELGASAIYAFPARGVGHNGLLDVMGLANMEANVLVCLVRESLSTQIILELTTRLRLKEDNHGLVFSVKLGAISKNALYGLLNMGKETEAIMGQTKKKDESKKEEDVKNEEINNDQEGKANV